MTNKSQNKFAGTSIINNNGKIKPIISKNQDTDYKQTSLVNTEQELQKFKDYCDSFGLRYETEGDLMAIQEYLTSFKTKGDLMAIQEHLTNNLKNNSLKKPNGNRQKKSNVTLPNIIALRELIELFNFKMDSDFIPIKQAIDYFSLITEIMFYCNKLNFPYATQKDLSSIYQSIYNCKDKELVVNKIFNHINRGMLIKAILTYLKKSYVRKIETLKELNYYNTKYEVSPEYLSKNLSKKFFNNISKEEELIILLRDFKPDNPELYPLLKKELEKNESYSELQSKIVGYINQALSSINTPELLLSFLENFKKNNPKLYPLFKEWLGESESWDGLKNFVSNFETMTQEFEEAREPEQLEITINKYQENLPLFTNPKFYLPHLSKDFFNNKRLTPTGLLKKFNIELTEDLLTRSPVFHKLLKNQLKSTFEFMELAGHFKFYFSNKDSPPESYLFDNKYPPNANKNPDTLLHDIINNNANKNLDTLLHDIINNGAVVYDKKEGNLTPKEGNITPEEGNITPKSHLDELKKAIALNENLLGCHTNNKPITAEYLIKKLESKIPPLTKITEFFLGLFQGCCGRQP